MKLKNKMKNLEQLAVLEKVCVCLFVAIDSFSRLL